MPVPLQHILTNLQHNLGKGLLTPPWRNTLATCALVPLFICSAALVGFGARLFKLESASADIVPLLLLMLFVFPALLEEVFFRGILIPREMIQKSRKKWIQLIITNTIIFISWHPINAFLFNHAAMPLFFNPFFLIIVGTLSITCSYSYVVSKSIWVPTIIHWVAVTLWVLFLGGHHVVLALLPDMTVYKAS